MEAMHFGVKSGSFINIEQPNYTSDLNAIMPLIAKLPDLAKFAVELVMVVKGTEHFPQVCMAEITEIQHTANCEQRAEAYCNTLNLKAS
jgi:hypothetical protein